MSGNQILAKRLLLVPKHFFSTTTTATAARNQARGLILSRKLVALGGGPKGAASVKDTVEDWVKSGNSFNRHDIIVCVNHLRKSNKFLHALQLQEWMEKGQIQMNNADRAIHVDLLGKTKGFASAEDYFNGLEESEKTHRTYGALLSCYCREKKIDKAKELFDKMKELGYTSSLNYNNMMSLYLKVGEPEKVPMLEKEMEELKVKLDLFTFNQLIDSYGAMKDFDAVDGVIEKVRKNKLEPNWLMLGNVATIYVHSGLVERAVVALQNLEKMNKVVRAREGFQTLITLYGRLNDPKGVYRVWEDLKATFEKPRNESYLIMLLALLKLNDVAGLEKWFTEWESNCTYYDVRLANVMLESYLNRNMINEADALYEKVAARGIKPNIRTADLFINYHLKEKKMDLALKFLEIGASRITSERNTWFPYENTIKMFLQLIEECKDEESAEKLYGIMKQIGRFDSIQKLEENDQIA